MATELGSNRATAFSLLKRAGVRSRYRILSDEDVEVARNMYEAGQSLAVIGEHFGVADRTVLNVFRRLGIPTRARGSNQWNQNVRDDGVYRGGETDRAQSQSRSSGRRPNTVADSRSSPRIG